MENDIDIFYHTLTMLLHDLRKALLQVQLKHRIVCDKKMKHFIAYVWVDIKLSQQLFMCP